MIIETFFVCCTACCFFSAAASFEWNKSCLMVMAMMMMAKSGWERRKQIAHDNGREWERESTISTTTTTKNTETAANGRIFSKLEARTLLCNSAHLCLHLSGSVVAEQPTTTNYSATAFFSVFLSFPFFFFFHLHLQLGDVRKVEQ